jgi:hypothetical protein
MGRADRQRDRSGRDKKRAVATAHLSIVPAEAAGTPGERGFEACPCIEKCTIHGECLLCVAYHGRKGRLPRCER